MNKIFMAVLSAGTGLFLAACSQQDNTGYSSNSRSPNGPGSGAGATNMTIPNAGGSSTRLQPEGAAASTSQIDAARHAGGASTNSEPDAAKAASSGYGEVPQGKASGEMQNLNGGRTSPAGTSVPNSNVNTNGVGNARSSESPNGGSTR